MICIRVDGNPIIGSGHVMRCLTIATELRKIGCPFFFLLAGREAEKLIKIRKFPYQVLDSDYMNLDNEIEDVIELVRRKNVKVMLIDSYFITPSYLENLNKIVKIAYIDDVYLITENVDILINYHLYAVDEKYKNVKDLLIGPMFAPLRGEFKNISYSVRDKIQDIFITTGGGDRFNIAEKITRKLSTTYPQENFTFHIVVGSYNRNNAQLQHLANENCNIILHKNITDMASLMKKCDVIISAGGTTMYEVCAVGVPTICFSFVDNQDKLLESFVNHGIALNGGNYILDQDNFLTQLLEQFIILLDNLNKRVEMSKNAKKIVDGLGALRIAKTLFTYI